VNHRYTRQQRHSSRRTFLIGSALAGVAFAVRPKLVRAASANSTLNIGIIGAGGRGGVNMNAAARGNQIVALCDVNRNTLAEAGGRFPDARTFIDYREMLADRHDMDAVVISTPDHNHAWPTLKALELGLHVYCEKPLTHSVYEARKVRQALEARPELATQMGIQIQAGANFRRVVELIHSGTIGPIREAHVWVSRGWGGGDRPQGEQQPPDHLDWNQWLGPAPERPYHGSYFPLPGWYKFWDFAGGTATDLGSHWNDLPFWALKLDAPTRIEAEGPAVHQETTPARLTVQYEFGQRGDLPPVTLYWTHGSNRPPRYQGPDLPSGWGDGALFIGAHGMILSDYRRHILLPDDRQFDEPEPFIERSPGHHAEWLRACRGGPKTHANFIYSAQLTEMNHLGNIAYRSGQAITWDAQQMRIPDAPEAQKLLRREEREGFEIG